MQIYTLRNAQGCEARISDYGGIVLSLTVPDRAGKFDDVVLGFDKLEDYLTPAYQKSCPYFGALIGRYGNRIANGTFLLGGREYHVPTNNGSNALHGGTRGFDKQTWQEVGFSTSAGGASLILKYVSPDGEEGFPGTLTTTAAYTLSDDNALQLDFEAMTDQETVLNLTQHTYFNLKGAGCGDILDHEMLIKAAEFVPMDSKSLPLGNLRPVVGTPFDFNRPTKIGARIDDPDEQLQNGMGYDHTFVLAGYVRGATKPRVCVRVTEPTSGRMLEVASDQPGVQLYTGNQLDGKITGKGGHVYQKRSGFCLEPQHFPDSPNRPEFPSVVLKPGETYRHTMIYRFSVLP